MDTRNQLQEDFISAMKQRKEPELTTLRLIRAEILNKEKEGGVVINEDLVQTILRSLSKKYKDSIQSYKDGGREDLVAKEQGELSVLEKYLPTQLSESDVREKINQLISSLSPEEKTSFGGVMGVVMKDLKGQADGGIINKIVKEILG